MLCPTKIAGNIYYTKQYKLLFLKGNIFSLNCCKAQDKAFIDDSLWMEIESEIDSIYPGYRDQLRKRYSILTTPDIQYCCFSLYGFSTNEEAILLGIVPESVSKKRTRIREKLQAVLSNTNLSAYLKKQYKEAL